MIEKEKYYKIVLEKISSIFSELNFIGSSIYNEIEGGNSNRITLKSNEVKNYLEIIRKNDKYFHKCLQGEESNWSLEKRVDYNVSIISSFKRQFEAVYFGTEKWYQRVYSLMNQLSDESRQLKKLLS